MAITRDISSFILDVQRLEQDQRELMKFIQGSALNDCQCTADRKYFHFNFKSHAVVSLLKRLCLFREAAILGELDGLGHLKHFIALQTSFYFSKNCSLHMLKYINKNPFRKGLDNY